MIVSLKEKRGRRWRKTRSFRERVREQKRGKTRSFRERVREQKRGKSLEKFLGSIRVWLEKLPKIRIAVLVRWKEEEEGRKLEEERKEKCWVFFSLSVLQDPDSSLDWKLEGRKWTRSDWHLYVVVEERLWERRFRVERDFEIEREREEGKSRERSTKTEREGSENWPFAGFSGNPVGTAASGATIPTIDSNYSMCIFSHTLLHTLAWWKELF